MAKDQLAVSVIGSGPLSLSIAGQLAHRGAEVTYVDLSAQASASPEPVIRFRGAVEYDAHLAGVTRDLGGVGGGVGVGTRAGAGGADLVLVAVTPSYYDRIFSHLADSLRDGQVIAFFPASFGALTFRAFLKARRPGVEVTICEVVSFPYVCDLRPDGTVFVHGIKKELRAAVSPTSQTGPVLATLNRYLDILIPAKSFLETSLDNMNMTLHPLPVLLNLHATETAPATFRHFIDGVTPSIGRLLEKLDAERMAIGRAYGLSLTSAIDQLKTYYGDRGRDTIAEYVTAPDGPYPNVKGFGIRSRYVTEDVPYLVVAGLSLADAAGVPAPTMELCVQLASAIMDVDYRSSGYTLARLGLEGLDREGILAAVGEN
jgi:opine dehydrogenase